MGDENYLRDTFFDSTVTKGSTDKEVMLPKWTTPMIRYLCKLLRTPPSAAQHIRAGVEIYYQTSSAGDGYIEHSGTDMTISKFESMRRDNVSTDYGRIKQIAPDDRTLLPLIVTVYLLVANRLYGQKLNGPEYLQVCEKAAKALPEWHVKHATGTGTVPSELSVSEGIERFMREPMGKWQEMDWYQKVTTSASPGQALQERDTNTATNISSPKSSKFS